jgi:hypothetical protein
LSKMMMVSRHPTERTTIEDEMMTPIMVIKSRARSIDDIKVYSIGGYRQSVCWGTTLNDVGDD